VMPYLRCMTSVHRCVECLTESDCTTGIGVPRDDAHLPASMRRRGRVPGDAAVFAIHSDLRRVPIERRLRTGRPVRSGQSGRCAFCAMDRSCGATAPYCDPLQPWEKPLQGVSRPERVSGGQAVLRCSRSGVREQDLKVLTAGRSSRRTGHRCPRFRSRRRYPD